MLPRVEIVIAAAERKQLSVIAPLHDAALLDNQNLVGAPNGGEPVGDDERGASLHQLISPPESSPLTRIERAGGFIENQDARLASSARAMDKRWRCPPESLTPRSPTIVS